MHSGDNRIFAPNINLLLLIFGVTILCHYYATTPPKLALFMTLSTKLEEELEKFG